MEQNSSGKVRKTCWNSGIMLWLRFRGHAVAETTTGEASGPHVHSQGPFLFIIHHTRYSYHTFHQNYQKDLQKLINRQARSITGMYQSSPISPLMSDSGLLPAHIFLFLHILCLYATRWVMTDAPAYILLDSRQRAYAHRLLSLPDSIPTKDILPITLRTGDGNAQPGDLCKELTHRATSVASQGELPSCLPWDVR